MTTTVVLHSGGMDSSVLLRHMAEHGDDAISFGVDYGQRHRKELDAASKLAEHYSVERVVVPLGVLAETVMTGSSQTSASVAVPRGHYAEENMKATVVPNRNMVLIALAGALCLSRGGGQVVYGAHAGDHTIYPDCRPEFFEAAGRALSLADWKSVDLVAPFIEITKADIVSRGIELGVPFDMTWSCYEGKDLACGRCGTCVERLEAFDEAGVVDPLEYSDREIHRPTP